MLQRWREVAEKAVSMDVSARSAVAHAHAWCSGAVSYYDAHFGLVLDKLEAIGKAQDTVVLVTGVSTFVRLLVE